MSGPHLGDRRHHGGCASIKHEGWDSSLLRSVWTSDFPVSTSSTCSRDSTDQRLRKNGNKAHEHIGGHLEQSLPEFDPASDFAVCGWVKSGVPNCTAIAISIECAELHESLVAIGEWDSNGLLQAIRAWSQGDYNHPERIWLRDEANARVTVGAWQHVGLVQTREDLSYFVNGRLVKSTAASRKPHAEVTKVCAHLCGDGPSLLISLSPGHTLSRTRHLSARAGGPVGGRDRRCEGVDTGSDQG
jgi:hypothetical protein